VTPEELASLSATKLADKEETKGTILELLVSNQKMNKAAHGFLLRRTFEYAAGENPGRTPLIGKMAIFEWKLSQFADRDEIQHCLILTVNSQQPINIIIKKSTDGT
jgi:hypothetical protein